MVIQGRSRIVLGEGPVGHFSVTFDVGDRDGYRFVSVEGMVDAGSTSTQVPRGILEELGIVPTDTVELELADGSVITKDIGDALVRLDGHLRTTTCVFADDDVPALLGVVTLEQFSLGVDPVNGRLVPVRGLAHGTR